MRNKLLIILALFLVSCTRNEQIINELDHISSQIQENASQAQARLDSLYQTNPEAFEHPDLQARYILLDTYCKYKLDREEENDSLICVAEEYFLTHGTDHDKMMAQFLHGSIYIKAENYENSYPLLLKALEAGKNTDDVFILGQICSHLFRVCAAIESPDRLHYAQEALSYYEKDGNPYYILDGKTNVGIALYDDRKYEECYNLMKETLGEALATNNTKPLIKSYLFLAHAEKELGLIDSAIVHLLQPVDIKGWPNLSCNWDLLADIEADLGNKELAYKYLSLGEEFARIDIDIEYHYKIKAKVNHTFGNDAEAYKAYCLYHHICDSILHTRVKNSVPIVERDNEKEKYEKSEYKRSLQTIGTLAILFTAIVGYFFIRLRRTIQRKNEENGQLKSSNEKLSKDNQEEKELFKQKTIYLLRQSKAVEPFKNALSEEYKIKAYNWQELTQSLQEAFPGFIEALMKDECITESELKICMLQKLNFQPNEIGKILNLASNTISSTSARLYRKRISEKGGAKEWQNYINSL